MASEQIANLSYVGIIKEVTKGTPLTPSVYLPIFSEKVDINMNIQDVAPIVGIKAARYSTVQGQRSFKGEIIFLGEPNTMGYLFDMIYTKGSTTGSNPYTHPFTLSTTTNPNSYSVDIKKGRQVWRFWGLEITDVQIEFDKNLMRVKCTVVALGCLSSRKITANASSVLTLDTTYDQNPTKGFVTSDLVRLFKADGTVVDTTISSINAGANTITVAASTGVAANDYVTLRPASPSYSFAGDYFTFGNTEFRISDTAANALTATHTGVEKSLTIKLMHSLINPDGELRSGSLSPVSLVRGSGDLDIQTQQFFDTPDDLERFLESTKRAMVIRSFCGTTRQYELRITADNMRLEADPTPLNVNSIILSSNNWKLVYDTGDAQMFDVKMINSVATI